MAPTTNRLLLDCYLRHLSASFQSFLISTNILGQTYRAPLITTMITRKNTRKVQEWNTTIRTSALYCHKNWKLRLRRNLAWRIWKRLKPMTKKTPKCWEIIFKIIAWPKLPVKRSMFYNFWLIKAWACLLLAKENPEQLKVACRVQANDRYWFHNIGGSMENIHPINAPYDKMCQGNKMYEWYILKFQVHKYVTKSGIHVITRAQMKAKPSS